jgi:hypothetical protein
MTSLDDLHQPQANSILSGEKETRNSRSANRKHIRMVASAFLEMLVESGMELGPASEKVARALATWPTMPESPSSATVQNWRDQTKAERPADRMQFDWICRELRKAPSLIAAIEMGLRNPTIGLPKIL